jgi:hypothetical protein
MNLPSFLTEKTVTSVMKLGALAVVALAAIGMIGYLAYLSLSQLTLDVSAMKGDLPFIKVNTEMLMDQHMQIGPAMEEATRIQCALCWNAAASAEEFDRCSCNPDK